MSHPLVVTLDRKSAPRTIFSGDRLVEVDLPPGTRCIYPRAPIAPLKDVDAAIRYAINHPYNSEPLHAKLRPGMKVVIAIDDISVPLPPMRRPDARERVLTVVLQLLADHGVDDIKMIMALGIHRRMTGDEIRNVVGDRIYNAYYPNKLFNHDGEDAKNMVEVGTTDQGELLELNRYAVESDLLIYVSLNLVPMSGGHKSIVCGLSSYKSLSSHHNPQTMRRCHSYMDPSPETSALAASVERMGKLANKKLNVFTIETTVNNRMFDRPLEFLHKNEDDLSGMERAALKALTVTLNNVPQPARQAIFQRVPSPYGVTGVFAGETEAAHAHTLARCHEQYLVPIKGQADILVMGVPYISPYNVNSFLNPLLVQVMVNGYLFNMYKGVPLLKKGGTMIVTHPCTDQFDKEHHGSYIEFVHNLLPETRDGLELHKRYEKKFASNPAYIQAFRTGHAYHPAHAFFMWYWGEAGRQYTGRVIVVGADNEYIPKLMGWETARTMNEALEMAKDTAPANPDIVLMHMPPIVMAEVTACEKMTFRRADEERSRELAVSREVDDSRAQLARLAEAGRNKQLAGAEELRARGLAEQRRAVPARFRERTVRSKRWRPFLTVWAALIGVIAIFCAMAAGWIGLGVLAFLFACFLWPLIPGSHWLFMIVMRQRDATAALEWCARLPFPIRDYAETLSLDHTLRHLRIRIAFAAEKPAPHIIDGLLGHLESGGERKTALVTGAAKCAILVTVEDEGIPNGAGQWVSDIFERVLLPLHAAYPINFTELAEAESGEEWEFGSGRGKLKALLD